MNKTYYIDTSSLTREKSEQSLRDFMNKYKEDIFPNYWFDIPEMKRKDRNKKLKRILK